jgi:chromosome segregation ATPase
MFRFSVRKESATIEIAELRSQLEAATATIAEQNYAIKEYQDKYRPICNELCELTLAHNELKEQFANANKTIEGLEIQVGPLIEELEQSVKEYERLANFSGRQQDQLKRICRMILSNLHDLPMPDWHMIKLTSKQVHEIGGIEQ